MKRYKLIAVLLVVALVAVLCAACTVTEQPQITVKVNGKEVKANGTVYAVEFDNDVTKAVIEATTTVGNIDGAGTFDLKEGDNEFVLTLKANDAETKYTVKVTRKAAEKPANVTLAEVKVGETVLTATAGKYATTVGYEVSSVTVVATATDSAATVEGAGEKALDVGKNEVTLTVKNGTETQNYTVEITREAAVLTLAEVKIGETAITADDNGVYNHTVANTVSSVTIAATATKSYATVEGAGEKTLNIGENTFSLTVKVDDNTKQQYMVKVVREAADLTLKEVKIGDEVLTAQDRTYTCNVANEVTQVTISAVANNAAATVDGFGTKENLAVGENRFEVTVSVGEEQAKYTIIVNRAKSSVKTIAKITVDGADATYDQAAKTYTATVGKFTAKVDIALTSSVSSYQTDEPIGTLAEGENEFVITVTAEDGTTETYSLVLNVVLPMFNVSYVGNIEGAVASEGYTYKYGDKQVINIVLAAPYTQSYQKLAVTYKVGDGEAKSVTLDENYGFEVSAAEAIGNIAVDVKGIEINTYTITYHRGGETTTEKVEYGKDAQNAAITPNTETKEVLDGYTYMHDEKWVTQDGGMIVANLTKITADADVYYKDEVLVFSGVETGYDNGVYKSLRTANVYLQEVEGTLTFKVLVTAYKEGETENTSFLLYGSRFSYATQLGVKVEQQNLNKWFAVVVKVADKKVTVYNPDGTIQKEETISECSADNFGYFVHADAKIAAVNPVIPELCTVTYLDETGGQITTEKVVKGSAATYVYNKPSEDLGDGYTRIYNGTTWLNASGDIVDLTAVSSNITVTYKPTEVLVYTTTKEQEYKPVKTYNKFIVPDKNGELTLKVRPHGGAGAFNIVCTNIWGNSEFGQWVDNTDEWWTIVVKADGIVYVYYPNGTLSKTSASEGKSYEGMDLNTFCIVSRFDSIDFAVVNADIVKNEFYDTDKTTLLHSELVVKGAISYVHKFEADSEGYVKTIDTWLPIDGAENKMYAAKATYSKTTTNPQLYNFVTLSELNKYVVANENGVAKFKVKFTFSEWTSFKLFETTSATETMQVGLDVGWSGMWFTFELDTANKTLKMTKPDGTNKAYDITSTDVLGYAFMRVGEKPFDIEVENL